MSLLWTSLYNNQRYSKASWQQIVLWISHFSLTEIHPHSQQYAEAAEAAAAQNKFWDMHDHLRSQHDDEHLEKVGLDLVRFNNDMSICSCGSYS